MIARHVYVHVPFCARRCTYCDFPIAVRRTTPLQAYLGALAREHFWADRRGPLGTIYLGGGTPSRLGADGIAQLARILGAHAGLVEFTLEANPDDVTPDAAGAWRRAGVTRLSIGGQSFDPRVLAWMHRTHGVEAIGAAVRAARAAGFRNLSLDLIFALPDSLPRDWPSDLGQAVALEPDHISLYGLTVENGTALARQVARGDTRPAPEGRYEEEYLEAHAFLARHGYTFYEVSNAARPGFEARHNSAYWRLAPYLGLGPGAHSFDGTSRWWNEPAYAAWLRLVQSGGRPVAGREVLSDEQRRLEQVYLSLRTAQGLQLAADEARRLRDRWERWVGAGWAMVSAAGLSGADLVVRLTPAGWLRLDELVASL